MVFSIFTLIFGDHHKYLRSVLQKIKLFKDSKNRKWYKIQGSMFKEEVSKMY